MKLRPVTYRLDMNAITSFYKPRRTTHLWIRKAKEAETQIGFLAQEVEKAAALLQFDFHGVDCPENENDHYGLRYAEFVPVLVKAMQEQQRRSKPEVKNSLNWKDLEDRLNKLSSANSINRLCYALLQEAVCSFLLPQPFWYYKSYSYGDWIWRYIYL